MFVNLQNLDAPAQGDLFEWVTPHQNSPWRTYGIVVTGDCDLAWAKTHGSVSYVPAFTMQDFIWFRWRIEKLPKILEPDILKLLKRLNTFREEKLGKGPVSREALLDLLSRSEPLEALEALGVTSKDTQTNLMNLAPRVKAFADIMNKSEPDLDSILRLFSEASGELSQESFHKKIQTQLESLAEDIFVIPSIPSDNSENLFVMLRSIGEIELTKLAGRPDQIRFEGAVARRIARVDAPYRYALTQKLARVFSDIGLPHEYEQLCKSASADFFEGKASQ